jgi:hypothetical protein
VCPDQMTAAPTSIAPACPSCGVLLAPSSNRGSGSLFCHACGERLIWERRVSPKDGPFREADETRLVAAPLPVPPDVGLELREGGFTLRTAGRIGGAIVGAVVGIGLGVALVALGVTLLAGVEKPADGPLGGLTLTLEIPGLISLIVGVVIGVNFVRALVRTEDTVTITLDGVRLQVERTRLYASTKRDATALHEVVEVRPECGSIWLMFANGKTVEVSPVPPEATLWVAETLRGAIVRARASSR